MFHFRSRSAKKSEVSRDPVMDAPVVETQNRVEKPSINGVLAVVELLEADLKRASRRLGVTGAEAKAQVVESQKILELLGAESGELAGHTGIALEHVNKLAQGCHELHRSAEEVGRRAETSQRLVDDAGQIAAVAARTTEELKQAIEQIQAVVSLISDVAGQTNLLALNATIEAARAGAAGRGFAVVANEVKSLSVETQKATTEIDTNIHRLRSVAEANIEAVERILSLVRDIGPVFGEVARSVRTQVDTTAEIGASASETARFVDEVSEKARRMSSEAARAAEIGRCVDRATGTMNGAVTDMTRQLVTVLRQIPAADRRRHDRWPVELRGQMTIAASRVGVRTIDLSFGGALVVVEGEVGAAPGSRVQLDLPDLGRVAATLVGKSALGLHLCFDLADEEVRHRVGACVDRLEADFRPMVERARTAAREVIAALDAAVERGDLHLGDLFDTEYRAVAGSDPIQYETRALAALEHILPPLQEAIVGQDKRMTFAACVDINGWLPVHNRIYSQPQRPGEVAWNTANCRNKRIFDDRTGLLAARNTRPFLIQSYLRDLGGGKLIPMKEIDVPIEVKGRHWGGLRTAYQM